MFIVISKYLKPLSVIDAKRKEHLDYLAPFFEAGEMLFGGRQIPPNGNIIVANSSSKTSLEAILSNDPLFKAGLTTYEIFEFTPGLYYKHLEDIVIL